MSRRLAIHGLLEGRPDAGRVESFLSGRISPIVEGPMVTVFWRGDADGVNLRHWIFGLESSTPLMRVPGTQMWFTVLEIPAGSRVEYKLEIVKGEHRVWIEDPRNPNRANDPFGVNSVILGDGYQTPEWTHPDPLARQGHLEPFRLRSKAFHHDKTGHIYTPARFRTTRKYPLLVVHDGTDYMRYADMKVVLDNLIHRLEIPDVIVAFTDSSDRLREYANDERHAKYIVEELVPHLQKRFPLAAEPRARCLMGASFGGVASLSTAWRYPGFFGRLLLQSGSFAFSDIGRTNRRGPAFEPVIDFMNQFRADAKRISERVYLSCGMYESLIYENRSMKPFLDATGMEVRLVESRDGHNWDNWRDRLREGLSYLFPGPLLFVYE